MTEILKMGKKATRIAYFYINIPVKCPRLWTWYSEKKANRQRVLMSVYAAAENVETCGVIRL